MHHVRSLHKYGCLAASFAMCLDCTFMDLVSETGQSGDNGRSWHYQEFYRSCLQRGYTPCMYVAKLNVENPDGSISCYGEVNLEPLILTNRAVIFYQSENYLHACAWDGIKILDPNFERTTLGKPDAAIVLYRNTVTLPFKSI